MTYQDDPQKQKDTQVMSLSSNELKAIFNDEDIVRLEYSSDEFPTPKTPIIIVFSKDSGKKQQYIELQEWFDLLEEYKENEEPAEIQPLIGNLAAGLGHGEEFVCIVSFRVNGDDEQVGEAIVSPEERDNCVNAILENYPEEHLDFSIELKCKQCFEEMLNEQSNDSNFGYASRMIH
ncbi:MAG: hypothetical protein DRR16_01820 [Candidatus Parabeggiatoa sp. nov. 3]|nr:MAG: hypothetical protein DRR00_03665 [Gammaproteobacteria bacterium]RKZ68960.1 MAG: hypothetical protein DRQ99_02225 [Gammaproteobacteria bacterium]RKZ89792.1 MAG: hypothetical protein DRR16_01820 [Gammaproteobacteria bacterium]HEW98507.1 hypothetical protein [Beggiatoa sp.]